MTVKDAVRLAILNVRKEGITDVDVFSKPFELNYLDNELNSEKIEQVVINRIESALTSELTSEASFKKLKINPMRSILVPKKNLFDFRKCSYIEPLDEIIYLSLVLMVTNKINKQRIPEKNDIVFSYRLKSNLLSIKEPDYIFNPQCNYTSFRSSIARKANDVGAKIIVECDISNFYDRLNLHRLQNTLLALKNLSPNEYKVINIINELLLFWSNRDSYGLPVGSNASRILAEASLISIDKYLLEKGIIFSRFVDDYRFFAKSAKEAHSWLSILVERLNQEGLFLNSGKTNIKTLKDISIEEKKEEKDSDNNSDMEKKDLPVIIRGYSGIIPTKFRKISETESVNLKELDLDKFRKEYIDSDLIDPKNLKKYIRLLVAKENWKELVDIVDILYRFPQFIPYYLDCISTYKDKVGNNIKKIENTMIELGNDSTLLEYLRVYIFRFLSTYNGKSKKYVLDAFYNLKRSEGCYLGRSMLEDIGNDLDRDDLLEIKKGFARGDKPEKRIILKLLHEKLNRNEFTPFAKNLEFIEDDPWIEIICNNKI